MEQGRFRWSVRPVALPENMVTAGKCRITVLTDRLLRLEQDPSERFVDQASQSVFFRDFPAVSYTAHCQDGWLTVETAALRLRYRLGEAFAADTLTVQLLQEPGASWHYGDVFETLGGTAQTLDAVNDGLPLGDGVCSRFGYTVLDDSETMLLDENGWIACRPEETQDLYFFGYGYDYRGCVKDYYRLTGVPPLLPAYALGNWWSRYHAYTQAEYLELIERFRQEQLPFSVAVVDMDWHITQVPGMEEEPDKLKNGWTGFTWNEELFPDWRGFLQQLHAWGYHTSLNLHPAAGVRKHECQYAAMAEAMGVDPASGEPIPFDILSPRFMSQYFDVLLHPMERDGVDFWWMDWQQGRNFGWIHEPNTAGQYRDPRERVDPLWMLNHLHILDISANGKRPMFFSRFSGPGSQRYPVGFSGDTLITWEALAFQPYFTATASNIGYGWWSHDIGGHMGGGWDDELTTRWIQLGVFSPILRLHSSNNEYLHKEPWYFRPDRRAAATDFLRLRHRLFPYLYTMNERCHTQLEELVQPMYYAYPKRGEAYNCPNQFWFGSELMVAAITQPASAQTGLAETNAWLPEGDWFDFFTGLHYAATRARRMRVFRPIDRYPVFAKAGAIVPLAVREPGDNSFANPETMELLVFPGADNTFTLYEDSGEGFDYEQGGWCRTAVTFHWGETAARLVVAPAEGERSLIPAKREWRIRLRGFRQNSQITATVNGQPENAVVVADSARNTVTVTVTAAVVDSIELSITAAEGLMHNNSDVLARCRRILMETQLTYAEKGRITELLEHPPETLHLLLRRLSSSCAENRDTVFALRELLTLTQEEYS